MPDNLLPRPAAPGLDRRLAATLARAATAIGRLDQALAGHALEQAFLHRARLDAVRRQAAVDGRAIDPWHLAAVLEGLRPRLDGALRIIDRCTILDAAQHALALHQWLVAPDFDQEGEVQRASRLLDAQDTTPLLAAATATHAWLSGGGHIGADRARGGSSGAAGAHDGADRAAGCGPTAGADRPGGGRAPMRAALVRHWTGQKLLRAPVPLTGAAALRAEQSWEPASWIPAFLIAVAAEAETWLDLLLAMERSWVSARRAAVGRRTTSRAPLAIDVLAAMPLVSASTLARALDMSIKSAGLLLDQFRADGIAVEVTHRTARRLFGLAGLAPLREVVAPPRRPQSGRGRGRPRLDQMDDGTSWLPSLGGPLILPAVAESPATPTERRQLDYGDLEAAMALADETIQRTRRTLDALLSNQA